jgi:chorismate--pyruvate lyase
LSSTISIQAKLEPDWADWHRVRKAGVPAQVYPWLRDTGSLTARVKEACLERSFRVRVLQQGWGRPLYGEGRLLSMRRGEHAVVREVELMCGRTPWVFARTLIPASSLRGPVRRLTLLGSKPLGAVLFADPQVERGPMQIARLLPRHPLFGSAVARIERVPPEIWGRRTLFYLAGRPILVNEIFLPDIPERSP